MKSKFFKDTQGLGECYTRCPPGVVCICLRMDRAAYEQLLREAEQLGITSGEYIQRLLEWHSGMQAAPISTPDCCCPDMPWVHQSRGNGWRENDRR